LSKANPQPSSPYESGGGGIAFENKVGALYLSYLLTGSLPHGIERGKIIKVHFQTKKDTKGFDDFLLIINDNDNEYKAFVQLRHDITFTARSSGFKDLIQKSWKLYVGSQELVLNPQDLIILGVGVYTKEIQTEYQVLLKWAYGSDNASDFYEKAKREGVSSIKKREFLETIETTLREMKEDITQDEILDFLKHLMIVYYDLDNSASSHKGNCINDLSNKLPINTTEALSLLDYLQLLSSEYATISGSIDKEKLMRKAQTIIPSLVEIPRTGLITLEQYKERKEIKSLLSKKYVGRQSELAKLSMFSKEPDKKIMIIVGHGGSGKTRLTVEFADQYKNHDGNIPVYFIDPGLDVGSMTIPEDSLLILDDAIRSNNLDRLLDIVGNSKSKLILVERSIFSIRIQQTVEKKGFTPDKIVLKKGGLLEFLKENYSIIPEERLLHIEQQSRDNYDHAIIFAEYYKEKRIVGSQIEALAWKTAKYLEDLRIRSEHAVEDIIDAVHLVSIIMPLNLSKDQQMIENISSDRIRRVLKIILDVARNGNTDLIVEEDSIFSIKPDPLADFLRIRALERDELVRLALELLQYAAFRITYNIYVIHRFEKTREQTVKQLLDSIWENLNNIEGKNGEYFTAILQIVNNFGDFKFTYDYKKANLDNWLKSFEVVFHGQHDEEIILLNIANTVANLLYHIALAKDIEYTKKFLNELTRLYNKYQTPHQLAFSMLVATALTNSVRVLGRENRIDDMLLCMTNLKSLSEAYKDILPIFVLSLHNAVLGCRNNNRMSELEPYVQYLKSVRNQVPVHLVDDIISEFDSSNLADTDS
jgi:hypothetical protein